MQEVDVNWIAVLVAGIAAMPLGALWYGPLFSQPWMRAVGKTREELQGPVWGYVLALFAWLVIAYVLSWVVDWAEADTLLEGLAVGFLMFVGFVATTMAVNTFFGGRSRALYLIDAGYLLLVFLIAGAIVGAWQ